MYWKVKVDAFILFKFDLVPPAQISSIAWDLQSPFLWVAFHVMCRKTDQTNSLLI